MNCPSCGVKLETDARFCGVCGHRLDGNNRPAAGAAASAPAGPVDPYIGTMLNNRFSVDAKLGEGGFGAVYRGTQSGTNRQVALKLLHPEMTRDENLVARFRREGLVLCNLRDAHTITTYDFDQTPDGTLYIAMELLEGKSLHEIFHAEAPIEWRRMFSIASQMCSSLSEAHAQGIVHRDLKPENIYLENRPGNSEFVKILDFGIAKVMRGDGTTDPKAPQLTATGQTLGTLEYMSPEQLMGKQLDGRSDVYAIGVLAYELTTGRLPFPDAKGPAGLITAQLRQVPDAPSVACPAGNIPAAVDGVVLKMLEKDKAKRFADVNELRRACEKLLATDGQMLVVEAPTSSASGHAVTAPSQQQHVATAQPMPQQPMPQQPMPPLAQAQIPVYPPHAVPAGPSTNAAIAASKNSSLMLWMIILGILVIGGAVGAILAFTV